MSCCRPVETFCAPTPCRSSCWSIGYRPSVWNSSYCWDTRSSTYWDCYDSCHHYPTRTYTRVCPTPAADAAAGLVALGTLTVLGGLFLSVFA
jgi:hypothetical protein